MRVQKTPTQKTCKISIDTDSINVESLIFNKSDKHTQQFMIVIMLN